MQDIPRITFLVIIDAFLVAMLVTMLSGCVTTPAKYRDRTGDFISNIASTAATISTAPPAASRAPVPSIRPVNVS